MNLPTILVTVVAALFAWATAPSLDSLSWLGLMAVLRSDGLQIVSGRP